MLGKTHLAVGVATALLVMRPRTEYEFAVTIIGGAVGGIMCDIDVKIDDSKWYKKRDSLDALYGEIAAILISLAALAAEWFSNGGMIVNSVMDHKILAIIGAVLFLALTVIGELSEHRDRTHSILALVLFTAATCLIQIDIGIAFGLGYLSHLVIDLFNKRPERLFYPFKTGICFNLCYSNGLVNDLLFSIGSAACVFYTLMFCRSVA